MIVTDLIGFLLAAILVGLVLKALKYLFLYDERRDNNDHEGKT